VASHHHYRLATATVKLCKCRPMKRKLNVIGKQLRAIRESLGLTQSDLAARCGARGWDIDKSIIYRIEAQTRAVFDSELLVLAKALRRDLWDFMPRRASGEEFTASINKPLRRRR
jgi:transcriptional regulator with XRE-family HTH domain